MNKTFSQLTELQKTELNMVMKDKHVAAGEWLWKKDEPCEGCFFIYSGVFGFDEVPDVKGAAKGKKYISGTVLGDFPNLTNNGPTAKSSCKCIEPGEVYQIEKRNLNDFLSKNPGVYVQICENYVVD